jgi:predicted membrane-bound spermidine synthase
LVRSGGGRKKVKALLVIWMGCHALVGQVILIREFLVISYGHELCLGIVFASWLGGILAGNTLGGRLRDSATWPVGRFLAWQSACVLLAPGCVVGLRLMRAVVSSGPGVPLPLAATVGSALGLVSPLSVAVGILFPLACSMTDPLSGRTSQAIAKVYVLEALGMLLGGVSLTFLLLPRMDHLAILAALGLVTLMTSTLAAKAERRAKAGMLMGLLSLSLAAAWVSGGVERLQEVSTEARWKALHPGLQRLATKESLYQSVELGNLEGQFSVFGNGHLLATFPDPYGAAFPAHLVMNQPAQPERLLVIGGGPGSLLPLLLSYAVAEVHVVDLDPSVFDITGPHLSPEIEAALGDRRVHLSFADARYWVRNIPPGVFDAVLLLVPDPSTALLNRYHTVEFFRDLSRVMRPPGVLMTSVTASVHYFGKEMLDHVGTLHRTLREVFPDVRMVPGERSIVLASLVSGTLTLDPEILARRMESRRLHDPFFPPEAFSYWLQANQIRLWGDALKDYEGPVNRDAFPLSYLNYLLVWELISGEKSGWATLARFKGLRFGWLLLVLTGVILAYVLAPGRGRTRRSRLTVLCLTGFTGMAQEILCLYVYQAVQGYLYSRIGVIIALFMAGLAGGGWLGWQCLTRGGRGPSRALLWDQGLLLLLCLAVPLGWVPAFFRASGPSWGEWTVGAAVGAWMLLAGVGTGAAFPLLCERLGNGTGPAARVAGQAGAADHLGAALGALLPATLIVPLFGLAHTGLFLAASQAASFLMVLLDLLDHEGGVG